MYPPLYTSVSQEALLRPYESPQQPLEVAPPKHKRTSLKRGYLCWYRLSWVRMAIQVGGVLSVWRSEISVRSR